MFRILVLVDIRERALYDCILALLAAQKPGSKTLQSLEVQFKPLELGDMKITLWDDDAMLREIVIERKTLPDMISSMRDGRYREQKARLLDNVSSCDIAYVIEGDSLCECLCRNDKAVSSAYFNMVFRDDIHIFFTRSVHETSLFLLSLSAKMLGKPGNYVSKHKAMSGTEEMSMAPAAKDYTACLKLKSKKNHNITPDNCFILQLAQVPSISNVIAKNIVKFYPTIGLLLDAMRTCTTPTQKIKLLSRIDKVGSVKAAKIIEYMHL